MSKMPFNLYSLTSTKPDLSEVSQLQMEEIASRMIPICDILGYAAGSARIVHGRGHNKTSISTYLRYNLLGATSKEHTDAAVAIRYHDKDSAANHAHVYPTPSRVGRTSLVTISIAEAALLYSLVTGREL